MNLGEIIKARLRAQSDVMLALDQARDKGGSMAVLHVNLTTERGEPRPFLVVIAPALLPPELWLADLTDYLWHVSQGDFGAPREVDLPDLPNEAGPA